MAKKIVYICTKCGTPHGFFRHPLISQTTAHKVRGGVEWMCPGCGFEHGAGSANTGSYAIKQLKDVEEEVSQLDYMQALRDCED